MATGVRNSHRPGDYLVVDDSSGLVEWRSDCAIQWDGLMVRKDQIETRHPQEFVRARSDPKALKDIRPDVLVTAADSSASGFVGQTGVVAPIGPASHVFLPIDIDATVGACVLSTPLGVSFGVQTPVVQIIVPPGVSVAATPVGINLVAVSGVAVSAVDPASPPEANLVSWYRADDYTAGSWPDHSANNEDLSQGTVANQPTAVADGGVGFNNQAVVRFDGANQHIFRDTTPSVAQDLTVVLIFKDEGADELSCPFAGRLAATNPRVQYFTGSEIMMYAGTVLQGTTGPGSPVLAEAYFNSTASVLRVNHAVEANGNAGADGLDGIHIGSEPGGTQDFTGDIAEVLVYDRALTASERNELAIYANERYGFDKPIPGVIGIPKAATSSESFHTSITVSAHAVETNTKAIVVFVGNELATGSDQDFPVVTLVSGANVEGTFVQGTGFDRFNSNNTFVTYYILEDPPEGTFNININLDSISDATVAIPINVGFCADAPEGDTGTGEGASGNASLDTEGLTTTGTNSLCFAFAVYSDGGSDPFTGGGGFSELADGATGISSTTDISFWLGSLSVAASATSVLPTVTPTTDGVWGMVAVEILGI